MSQAQAMDLLRQAIVKAKANDKPAARELLRQASTLDAGNENVWLWLAGVTDQPIEAVQALEQALRINPANERTRVGLRTARLNAGIVAARANNRPVARDLLRQACADDPGNENAWLWLAGVCDSADESIGHLEQVLRINPGNERARSGLEFFRGQKATTVKTASSGSISVGSEVANHEANSTGHAASGTNVLGTNVPQAPVTPATQNPGQTKSNQWYCPVCMNRSETKFLQCPSCSSVLSLAHADQALNNTKANHAKIQEGIVRLTQATRTRPDFASHYYLGMAYLNISKMEDGLAHIRAAQRLKPEDEAFFRHVAALEQKKAAMDLATRPGVKPIIHEKAVTTNFVQNLDFDQPVNDERKKILVVDDSPTIRKLVSMTLLKNGLRSIEANDGNEALEKIDEHGIPDLVLLDINMPGMDGYTLCKLLRQKPETAKLPVIMLSGKDGFFNKIRGKMAGSTLYLTKPFQPDALLRVIQKYCTEGAPQEVGS
jgi:twitching motility two-component system response regulator PilG